MLSSITPLGERGRASRWSLTVAAYVVASAAAGALLGALLGVGGAVLGAVGGAVLPGAGLPVVPGVLLALAVLAAAGLALDARVAGLRLPTPARQVDEDWLARYRGWVYGAGFGAQLGLGVVTIVTTSTLYLTWAAAALSASAAAGAAIGAVFGLARALPVLAVRRVVTPQSLAAAFARLEGARPAAQTWSMAASGALAGTTALVAVLTAGGLT